MKNFFVAIFVALVLAQLSQAGGPSYYSSSSENPTSPSSSSSKSSSSSSSSSEDDEDDNSSGQCPECSAVINNGQTAGVCNTCTGPSSGSQRKVRIINTALGVNGCCRRQPNSTPAGYTFNPYP